jgi:hypothetical protein
MTTMKRNKTKHPVKLVKSPRADEAESDTDTDDGEHQSSAAHRNIGMFLGFTVGVGGYIAVFGMDLLAFLFLALWAHDAYVAVLSACSLAREHRAMKASESPRALPPAAIDAEYDAAMAEVDAYLVSAKTGR